jgi:UDP-3-O-[3-hydroxymyristoyl] glucosamine N-acyltransferase
MKFTATQIAGILQGEVVGNPKAEVFKLAKIEEGTEGSLTFLANPKYNNYIIFSFHFSPIHLSKNQKI